MLAVYSPAGTGVCDIPPEPTRSRVRARPRGSRPAAWPPAQRVAFDARGSRRAKIGGGLVLWCRGTFENQAKGIVARRDETAKPARASGTRGRARPQAGRQKIIGKGLTRSSLFVLIATPAHADGLVVFETVPTCVRALPQEHRPRSSLSPQTPPRIGATFHAESWLLHGRQIRNSASNFQMVPGVRHRHVAVAEGLG
jgi:hypothetical protein